MGLCLFFFAKKFVKKLDFYSDKIYPLFLTLLLPACSNEKNSALDKPSLPGFSPSYIPPKANFDQPINSDPFFKVLEATFVEPYWTRSLEMDDSKNEINKLLGISERSITYSFPFEPPSYLPITISGWAPANSGIMTASREIFIKLANVLDITIEETDFLNDFNNISVA